MARKPSFLQKFMANFRQILPPFAAWFSSVFADVVAPGDDSGKHQELAQVAVYLTVLVWAIVHALLALELYTMKQNIVPVYTYFLT
jgi:hypothetical protein